MYDLTIATTTSNGEVISESFEGLKGPMPRKGDLITTSANTEAIVRSVRWRVKTSRMTSEDSWDVFIAAEEL